MIITIRGAIPSQKNAKRSTRNPYTGRIIVYTEPRVKAWQNDVDVQLIGQRMVKGPVEIKAKFWHKDNRPHDLDNEFTSICDRLKGKVIEDDNCKVLKRFSCEYMGVDKDNPRAELEITPIT